MNSNNPPKMKNTPPVPGTPEYKTWLEQVSAKTKPRNWKEKIKSLFAKL